MRAAIAAAKHRRRGGMLAARLVLAAALFVGGAPGTAKAAEDWVPTGYDEHARAAWAFLLLTCGPAFSEGVTGPVDQELCSSVMDVSQVWLGFALAWTELPADAASAGELQVFPRLEPAAMQKLAALAVDAAPTWEIVANPDLARAPDSFRQQLLDGVTRSYDIALRTALIKAKTNDPGLLATE